MRHTHCQVVAAQSNLWVLLAKLLSRQLKGHFKVCLSFVQFSFSSENRLKTTS